MSPLDPLTRTRPGPQSQHERKRTIITFFHFVTLSLFQPQFLLLLLLLLTIPLTPFLPLSGLDSFTSKSRLDLFSLSPP